MLNNGTTPRCGDGSCLLRKLAQRLLTAISSSRSRASVPWSRSPRTDAQPGIPPASLSVLYQAPGSVLRGLSLPLAKVVRRSPPGSLDPPAKKRFRSLGNKKPRQAISSPRARPKIAGRRSSTEATCPLKADGARRQYPRRPYLVSSNCNEAPSLRLLFGTFSPRGACATRTVGADLGLREG